MSWRIEFDARAVKELRALDRPTRRRILRFLHERVAGDEDPRRIGVALKGQATPLWRYRVGDHRLVCSIEDDRLIVLIVRIGHRREVYR